MRIALGDLQTDEMKPLIGRYRLKPAEYGKPVTPAMAADAPTLPPMPTAIAIVVNVPKAESNRLRFDKGASVKVGFKTRLAAKGEPPRVFRRPFGLNHAAMAGSLVCAK